MPNNPTRPPLPAAPAVIAGFHHTIWLSADGEVETLSKKDAAARIRPDVRPLVCHARAVSQRLDVPAFDAYDLLELFAFVRPAQFTLPTPRGLAEAVGVPLPGTPEKEAESLFSTAKSLLSELSACTDPAAAAIARAMTRGGWAWGPSVLAMLDAAEISPSGTPADALRIWNQLPEWQEQPPQANPGNEPVGENEARTRVIELRGDGAENRIEQLEYASAAAAAFAPRERDREPRFVIAECGTGVGKTLGYIAPASLWTERNESPVWISTFTRNLQRQLNAELDRLHPDPDEKSARVVIRKGRENYFCVLNFEEALRRLPTHGGVQMAALGLMARWALATRDGDMIGGDFPAWLKDLLGTGLTTDLTDTRGECLYSACPHYAKCFVEHTVRRAKQADIVIANHALVMVQAACGGNGEGILPTRYVFDEGHHLFEAADGAFSAHLSGRETADLRRWLIGAEESSRSRSRGLKARLEDLVAGDAGAEEALDEVLRAARSLPGPGWSQRIGGGTPRGPAETFLALVRQQVYARDANPGSAYSLETETSEAVPGLREAAGKLEGALARLGQPMTALIRALAARLDANADELDTRSRTRIEALMRSIERRGVQQAAAWRAMLQALAGKAPEEFVDWFGVERIDGRDFDVGFHRHWIDPTRPFVEIVAEPAHGVLVTSATLCDRTAEDPGWATAEMRTGAVHLSTPAGRAYQPSPFDYAELTRILVVGDVARDDMDQVAAAYRELFLAANGGALGLFTAISRMRAVHERISTPLDEAGLPLFAQHIDAMDTGTLVDIFRSEEDACLLGTDAVRDGVDVPGRSLRLIVFDRIPWPRPDILHRARRKAFGGRAYDEMLTRIKLKQAYGRLVRRRDDRGIFVMLDRALPTRLTSTLPEGVRIQRIGLAEAIAETASFLNTED
ncbi:MAG: hypothetical protein CFH05_01209 [Alphaproteobacteria bacterium MarineAlpha3_Bin4]|nr:MAG: hypothetical protein CFH05_01209 [Alphaproteobacteria bacterium MarineAlpha3_Bin4]